MLMVCCHLDNLPEIEATFEKIEKSSGKILH
jgi:hypothetical protein